MKKSVKAFAAASLVALFATVAMSCGSTAAPAKAEEPKPAEEQPAEDAAAKKDDSNEKMIRDIEKRFWKGEVANIGANEIISPYNSAGQPVSN